MTREVDKSSFEEFIRPGLTLISFWTALVGTYARGAMRVRVDDAVANAE